MNSWKQLWLISPHSRFKYLVLCGSSIDKFNRSQEPHVWIQRDSRHGSVCHLGFFKFIDFQHPENFAKPDIFILATLGHLRWRSSSNGQLEGIDWRAWSSMNLVLIESDLREYRSTSLISRGGISTKSIKANDLTNFIGYNIWWV